MTLNGRRGSLVKVILNVTLAFAAPVLLDMTPSFLVTCNVILLENEAQRRSF
jgi:hypothetical protein